MRDGIVSICVLALSVTAGAVAFAKGGKAAQNHHCAKDGATLEGNTKRECEKEGGKWEKDAAAEAPAGGDAKPAAEMKK